MSEGSLDRLQSKKAIYFDSNDEMVCEYEIPIDNSNNGGA